MPDRNDIGFDIYLILKEMSECVEQIKDSVQNSETQLMSIRKMLAKHLGDEPVL